MDTNQLTSHLSRIFKSQFYWEQNIFSLPKIEVLSWSNSLKHAWWPLMLGNCFIHFTVEHRFGCRTAEPGYAGDTGAIEIWLIDFEQTTQISLDNSSSSSKSIDKIIPFTLDLCLGNMWIVLMCLWLIKIVSNTKTQPNVIPVFVEVPSCRL